MNESYVGIYVSAWEPNKAFHLADYSVEDAVLPNTYPGLIYKKTGSQFVQVLDDLTEEEKNFFTADPVLKQFVQDTIVKNCENGSNYDAAVWACHFNPFLQGFSTFHFEV